MHGKTHVTWKHLTGGLHYSGPASAALSDSPSCSERALMGLGTGVASNARGSFKAEVRRMGRWSQER